MEGAKGAGALRGPFKLHGQAYKELRGTERGPRAGKMWGMGEEHPTFRELDVIAIPEDVPDVGIKAGDPGTIVDVFPGGHLTVEVIDGQGRTLALLDLQYGPPLEVVGRWPGVGRGET